MKESKTSERSAYRLLRCSALLGHMLFVCIVVFSNLLFCCFGYGEGLPEMRLNRSWGLEATIQCRNQVHRVDEIKVERIKQNAGTLHLGQLKISTPIFDGRLDRQLPDLSALLAAAGNEKIPDGETTGDNRRDSSANHGSNDSITRHDVCVMIYAACASALIVCVIMCFIMWWVFERPYRVMWPNEKS